MKQHPLSESFPSMSAEDLKSLKEDIKKNGQRDPITIYHGMVLDGWHRHQACESLKISPLTYDLPDSVDPVSYVLSRNLHRRHMTASQRAVAVAACHEWRPVGRPSNVAPGATLKEMAKKAEVSERTMRDAKEVIKAGKKDEVVNGHASVKSIAHPEKPKDKPADSVGGNDAQVFDKMGYPVPPKIIPLWNRGPEVSRILSIISEARCALRKATEEEDLLYSGVSLNSALSRLDLAYSELEPATPSVVCTSCQGVTPKSCTLCRGRGFISKFSWRTHVPEEIRDMRKARIKELQEGKK